MIIYGIEPFKTGGKLKEERTWSLHEQYLVVEGEFQVFHLLLRSKANRLGLIREIDRVDSLFKLVIVYVDICVFALPDDKAAGVNRSQLGDSSFPFHLPLQFFDVCDIFGGQAEGQSNGRMAEIDEE